MRGTTGGSDVFEPPAQNSDNPEVRSDDSLYSHILNISKDEDSKASLDKLFQCLSILIVVFFFLVCSPSPPYIISEFPFVHLVIIVPFSFTVLP